MTGSADVSPTAAAASGGCAGPSSVRDSAHRFELLADTAGELLRSRDPQRIVDSLCRKVLEHLNCDAFFNYLLDEPSEKLRLNAYAGIPQEQVGSLEWLDVGVAVCGCVARTGERVVAERIPETQDPRFDLVRSFGIRAYACHPLLGPGDKVIGTLSFGTRARDTFDPDDLSLMKAVADQVAAAMVRMRGEEALRESERRWRQLAESMPQLVWTCAASGECDYLSTQWVRYTGRPEAEQLGYRWMEQVHPEDRNRLAHAWAAAVDGGKTFDVEFRIRRHDGDWRWFKTRAVPIRDVSGRILRWYGSNTDIEDLMRAVSEMRVMQDALRKNETELREADRRKDEFLATLSHELRNPLGPIHNSLYVLDRVPPGGEESRAARATIDRQITHVTKLVEELLDVTRVTRGKIQLRRERIELRDLAARTVEDHRAAFSSCGVDLRVEEGPEPVLVDGDRTRLAQVLDNLLLNAVKFTPSGGSTTVRVGLSAEEPAAVLEVVDTGAGIPEAILPHLFQPFMQADRTLDRTAGGLGLGLALVRGLVELHGGSVSVASEGPGRGAAFTVRLPLDRTEGGPQQTSLPAAEADVSRRVLIIEDNVDAASSFRAVLRLMGHEVEVAHSGQEGIEAARVFAPDVILCDIGLPGMDGYAVARALRAEPETSRRTLIALSGYATPGDVRRSKESGFDEHLAKPLPIDRLRAVLRSR